MIELQIPDVNRKGYYGEEREQILNSLYALQEQLRRLSQDIGEERLDDPLREKLNAGRVTEEELSVVAQSLGNKVETVQKSLVITQTELTELSGSVDGLADDVTALEGSVGALEADVAGIHDSLDTVTDYTITPTNVTGGSVDALNAEVWGKFCRLHMLVKATGSVSAGSNIVTFTLPQAYRPRSAGGIATGAGYYTSRFAVANVEPGGAVTVRALSAFASGNTVHISMAYLLA